MGYIKKTCYIVCGLIAALAVWSAYSDRVQGEIASEVMRFHVLANSDSGVDQAVKLAVRDGILAALSACFGDDGMQSGEGWTLEETRGELTDRLDEVERIAEDILREHDAEYGAYASISEDYFPTRTYNGVTLPAGVYETLRVELGAASGQNWWCVMFPPLCFVDIAVGYAEIDEPKQELENLLSAESYDITSNTETVKVRFFIVELWQKAKHLFNLN